MKNQGNRFFKNGDYQGALEIYQEATNLNTRYAPAWFNQGQCHKKLGNYFEALKCYNVAITLNPDYDKAERSRQEIVDNHSQALFTELFLELPNDFQPNNSEVDSKENDTTTHFSSK